MDMKNVRVDYESTPIRHVAVECPSCNEWYAGNDISDISISDSYHLSTAKFTCPDCNIEFKTGLDTKYDEKMGSAIYEGVKRKQVMWR